MHLTMFMIWIMLLYSSLTRARLFTPQEASTLLNAAAEANPVAVEVRNLCGIIGRSDQECAYTFFSNDIGKSSITSQATINCMDKIEASQEQTQALLAALNADPSELSKYAQVLQPTWYIGPNGEKQIKDASPSDQRRASGIMRKRYEKIADYSIGIAVRLLNVAAEWALKKATAKIPSADKYNSAVQIGVDVDAVIEDFLPKEEVVKWFGDKGAEYGAQFPELVLDEFTGICTQQDPKCRDTTDNTEYPNKHYRAPDVEAHKTSDQADTDPFETTDTDVNMSPVLPETPPPPQHSGVDDPPDITDEDEVIVTIDPDADKDAFLKQCVRQQEQLIIKELGTKTINDDPNRVPVTEEEKKKKAEWELRMGLCDKTYWGKDYCNEWKQDQWRVPMDPETVESMQLIQLAQNWLCPPAWADKIKPCGQTREEVDKRYDMNQLWDNFSSAVLGPRPGPIVHIVPIEFGPPEVIPAVDLHPVKGSPITVSRFSTTTKAPWATSRSSIYLPTVTVPRHPTTVKVPWATII